jgi:hypothetical protein
LKDKSRRCEKKLASRKANPIRYTLQGNWFPSLDGGWINSFATPKMGESLKKRQPALFSAWRMTSTAGNLGMTARHLPLHFRRCLGVS